jgi:hypothetical protein
MLITQLKQNYIWLARLPNREVHEPTCVFASYGECYRLKIAPVTANEAPFQDDNSEAMEPNLRITWERDKQSSLQSIMQHCLYKSGLLHGDHNVAAMSVNKILKKLVNPLKYQEVSGVALDNYVFLGLDSIKKELKQWAASRNKKFSRQLSRSKKAAPLGLLVGVARRISQNSLLTLSDEFTVANGVWTGESKLSPNHVYDGPYLVFATFSIAENFMPRLISAYAQPCVSPSEPIAYRSDDEVQLVRILKWVVDELNSRGLEESFQIKEESLATRLDDLCFGRCWVITHKAHALRIIYAYADDECRSDDSLKIYKQNGSVVVIDLAGMVTKRARDIVTTKIFKWADNNYFLAFNQEAINEKAIPSGDLNEGMHIDNGFEFVEGSTAQ